MIPHIVFEALIKHYMYRTAPAKFRFIACPLGDSLTKARGYLVLIPPSVRRNVENGNRKKAPHGCFFVVGFR